MAAANFSKTLGGIGAQGSILLWKWIPASGTSFASRASSGQVILSHLLLDASEKLPNCQYIARDGLCSVWPTVRNSRLPRAMCIRYRNHPACALPQLLPCRQDSLTIGEPWLSQTHRRLNTHQLANFKSYVPLVDSPDDNDVRHDCCRQNWDFVR